MKFATALILLLISVSVFTAEKEVKNRIAGRWETTDISGDCVDLLVSSVTINLKKDNKFDCNISYTDFTSGDSKGSYKLSPKHILIDFQGTTYKLAYKLPEKDKIVIKDTSYGVSASLKKLKKGEKPTSSSWF